MSEKAGRSVVRPTTTTDTSKNGVSTPGFQGKFPNLWEFLSKQRDYGELHKTGCVTMFVDGDKIKLCVNDRPARQSCFLSGDTLMEALARVDRGLEEGSLNWSSSGYKKRPRKKVDKRTPMFSEV